MGGFRDFYLKVLKADELNVRFAGPIFIFMLFSASVFLLASWYADDGGTFDFPANLSLAEHEDFAAFYRAGEMAREGEAVDAYDYYQFSKYFSESNRFLLFLNPPHALLFFEPLSLFSYPVAKAIFMAINAIFLIGAIHLVRMNLGVWPYFFAIASAGAVYSFQLLQIAPITTFLLLFALLRSREQPLLAGLALSVLTIKPQFGLLVPIFLIARQDWRAFGAAAVGSSILMLVSVFVYGFPVWQAFMASLAGGVHSIQFEAPHSMMITVGQTLGKFGSPVEFRTVLQILMLPVFASVVWWAARSLRKEAAVSISLLAMAIAAPSFLFYDWLIYSVALLLMAKVMPKWPISLQVTGGVLWIAPVIHDVIYQHNQAAAMYFSGFIPFLAVLVLILAVFCFRDEKVDLTSLVSDKDSVA
ncbi:glycosyltransferase family 87 protein [Roseibium sp. SCPC15]|uniref:glycosyltransferase family 87 protein n=1 Tax=Roseibium sp. SCP15 TaxID=3141376 RepID=UPI00333B7A69